MSFATSALRTLMLALFAGLSLPLAAQTQTPFGGTPIPLPGTFEAENFDNGGEGVAYHDNVAGNLGGKYRTGESVDIIDSRDTADPAGFVVNNFETGEWLEYTVNIQAAGQYEIAIRTASGTSTGAFHVEIDGNNVTGTVSVAPTGDFGTFTWVAKRGVSLPAGEHVLRLVSEQQYFDVNQIRVTATPSTPFAGVISLPGTFEAENFDNGGQDVAYSDTTAPNDGGQFRTTEGVDIIGSRDPDDAGTGYSVNNFHAGEWMVYTVSVANSGLYDIEARVATGTFTNAAIHIEIDGVNVTGSMLPGATGNFGTYTWVKKPGVQLSAGQHVLKLVSDQEIADVNRIRVTAVTHTPFTGTPIPLPGTFEAENFDNGGEGNAYHDTDATNDGGAQFRLSEGVDIKPSPDSGGGTYVINNFQTGEWLVYTVNVAQGGSYDIDLRAATGATTSAAYHIEIDGNVNPSVPLPATGSFGAYAWIGRQTVQLTAGLHVLKIVSDQQYVDVNQIRVGASTTPPPNPPELLFRSGFEGISFSAIGAPQPCDGSNCYQNLQGTDSASGFAWPPQVPGGGSSVFKLRAGDGVNPTPSTISQYIENQVVPVTGHTGAQTQAQWSRINKNCHGTTAPFTSPECSTQDTYMVQPASEPSPDLYISFWRKLEPDLLSKFGGQNWYVVFEWKTAGDMRLGAQIVNYGNVNAPYFLIQLDNVANQTPFTFHEYWRCPYFDDPNGDLVLDPACNAGVFPVPAFGSWFKFEVFWHRSTGNDGRVWMAVNGTVIVDRFGPTKIAANIDRIMYMQLYSDASLPLEQWTDDVQIWTKIPVGGADARPGDPRYDPPYGMRLQ